jgi:hypothetical protein
LPDSTYTLTVEASGFKTFKQQGIMLEVGQSVSQSISLTVGSSTQIEVTAAAPLLQTDNANLSAEVSSKQVQELPLNLRNVFNFVELNSSVNNLSQRQTISSGGQQGSADQDVSFLNFGGGYFGTNAFLLDGAWDTSEGWGGVIYVPSPDNVQEFKVQQNSLLHNTGGAQETLSTWSRNPVAAICTETSTIICATRPSMRTTISTTWPDCQSRFHIVINLALPLAARCTFQASTNKRTRRSSSSTTKAIEITMQAILRHRTTVGFPKWGFFGTCWAPKSEPTRWAGLSTLANCMIPSAHVC